MSASTGTHPRRQKIEANIAASAQAVTTTIILGRAQFAGHIESATYTPVANLTGVDTNTRRLRVINKGQDGNGAVVMAELTFANGVNALDFDDRALTLQGAAGAAVRDCAVGDVIALESAAVASGLADPGGNVQVVLVKD